MCLNNAKEFFWREHREWEDRGAGHYWHQYVNHNSVNVEQGHRIQCNVFRIHLQSGLRFRTVTCFKVVCLLEELSTITNLSVPSSYAKFFILVPAS